MMMVPADDVPLEKLVGRRVVFKQDEEHAGCWHRRMGLQVGMVLKLGQTVGQKAELLSTEMEVPPEVLALADEPIRLWVKADPCTAFPRGCETAVEPGCLLVDEGLSA